MSRLQQGHLASILPDPQELLELQPEELGGVIVQLGAGFSKAIHPAMPVLDELTKSIWSQARKLIPGNRLLPFRGNIELLLS
jgi:hypothetical protein